MGSSAGLESSAKEECWKSRSGVAQVWLRPKVSSLLRVRDYGKPMGGMVLLSVSSGRVNCGSVPDTYGTRDCHWVVCVIHLAWYWGPGKYMKAETVQYSGTHQRRRARTMSAQSMCAYRILLSTPRFEYISPRREDGAWEHGDWNH